MSGMVSGILLPTTVPSEPAHSGVGDGGAGARSRETVEGGPRVRPAWFLADSKIDERQVHRVSAHGGFRPGS